MEEEEENIYKHLKLNSITSVSFLKNILMQIDLVFFSHKFWLSVMWLLPAVF